MGWVPLWSLQVIGKFWALYFLLVIGFQFGLLINSLGRFQWGNTSQHSAPHGFLWRWRTLGSHMEHTQSSHAPYPSKKANTMRECSMSVWYELRSLRPNLLQLDYWNQISCKTLNNRDIRSHLHPQMITKKALSHKFLGLALYNLVTFQIKKTIKTAINYSSNNIYVQTKLGWDIVCFFVDNISW